MQVPGSTVTETAVKVARRCYREGWGSGVGIGVGSGGGGGGAGLGVGPGMFC